MRGTTSKTAFKHFKQAIRGFPVTTQAGFDASVELLKKALAADPNYPRAKGWLAYAYATGANDVWLKKSKHKAEAKWTQAKALKVAEGLAKEAVESDEGDYDNHWALAYVQLNKKSFGDAKASYERALDLNDNNMNLLAEMADGLVHMGRPDDAIEKIFRARRVWDWHRWVLAWAYYFKGRTDPIYYDLALSEIREMYLKPGEAGYTPEVLLLSAALHAQKEAVYKKAKRTKLAAEPEEESARRPQGVQEILAEVDGQIRAIRHGVRGGRGSTALDGRRSARRPPLRPGTGRDEHPP